MSVICCSQKMNHIDVKSLERQNGKTVETQTILLLKEQSDLGLHLFAIPLHHLEVSCHPETS